MKMTKLVLVLTITLLFAPTIQAESMRCGTHVIEEGQLHNIITIEEVIKKCGKPTSRTASRLYYKEKGKELHFDTEGLLMSIQNVTDR